MAILLFFLDEVIMASFHGVRYKTENGEKLEPMEEVTIEVQKSLNLFCNSFFPRWIMSSSIV